MRGSIAIVIDDNGSTDGSLELLGRHPKVEVRRFQRVILIRSSCLTKCCTTKHGKKAARMQTG